jgi:hypothetical protein
VSEFFYLALDIFLPTSSTERADQWFAYLETILYDVIPPIPKKNEDRIRIAILDTGICMTDHYLGLKENRKRITYQSFVKNDPDPNNPIDLSGHGTHAAALLVRVAHNADIYVARISKTEELEDPHQIATVSDYFKHPLVPCLISNWYNVGDLLRN